MAQHPQAVSGSRLVFTEAAWAKVKAHRLGGSAGKILPIKVRERAPEGPKFISDNLGDSSLDARRSEWMWKSLWDQR